MKVILLGQALITAPVVPRSSGELAFRDWLRSADAVVANLEASIAPEPAWPMKSKTVVPTSREAVASLAELGVTHVSLANNHAWDFGPVGVRATVEAAEAAGMAVAGAGESLVRAAAPRLTRTPAGTLALVALDLGPSPDFARASDGSPPRPGINSVRIERRLRASPEDSRALQAIVARTGQQERARRRVQAGYDAPPPAEAFDFYGLPVLPGDATGDDWIADEVDLARVDESLRAARGEADVVVVSVHNHNWSPAWTGSPDWLRALCRRWARAGADAVFAHGPPVALGHVMHRGRPILHGMGNLVFHTRRPQRYAAMGADVWTGLAAEITIGSGASGHRCCVKCVSVARPGGPGEPATAPAFRS